MAKKKKLKSISKLEKSLWTLFSLAVRVKWADDKGNCTCITCGNKNYYLGTGSVHAGHFRPRSQKVVKYDFRNVHPQCAGCNTFNDGEQYIHGKWIDKEYGEGTADELTRLGKLTMKGLGINMRDHIEEKTLECIKILADKGSRFTDWQSKVTKTLLKQIENEL